MQKTVLTFGLISGAVSSIMMLAMLPFVDAIGFEKGEILGYTMMVLSGLLIFFGVRSYRENVGSGRLSFARGLGVGLLITLISCLCYVVTWEVVYFKFMPDFGAKYAASMVARARSSGASPQKIEEVTKQAQDFKRLYDNPAFNAAITFVEPFPVSLAMTALSAAILRKR
jgi:hypothetical protein